LFFASGVLFLRQAASRREGNAPNTLAKDQSKSGPRIWLDRSGSEVAEMVANSPTRWLTTVYRWENGYVDGWVRFNDDGKPVRTPLDHQRRLVGTIALNERDQPPLAGRLSGMAIVQVSEDKSGSWDNRFVWFKCAITIQTNWFEVHDGENSARSARNVVSGWVRMKRDRGPNGPDGDGKQSAPPRGPRMGHGGVTGDPSVIRFEMFTGDNESQEGDVWLELRLLTPES
jgi:hypothetical protein